MYSCKMQTDVVIHAQITVFWSQNQQGNQEGDQGVLPSCKDRAQNWMGQYDWSLWKRIPKMKEESHRDKAQEICREPSQVFS